ILAPYTERAYESRAVRGSPGVFVAHQVMVWAWSSVNDRPATCQVTAGRRADDTTRKAPWRPGMVNENDMVRLWPRGTLTWTATTWLGPSAPAASAAATPSARKSRM